MRTWQRLRIYAHSLFSKRAFMCTNDACRLNPAHRRHSPVMYLMVTGVLMLQSRADRARARDAHT